MQPDRPVKPAKKRRPRPAAGGEAAEPARSSRAEVDDGAPAEAEAEEKGVAPREDPPLPETGMRSLAGPGGLPAAVSSSLRAPEPALRLEIIRIFAPLATLGFMSSRLAHADEWLTDVGFQIPQMTVPDWRQPLYLSPLSTTSAWALAAVMVLSGLAVSLGFRARAAALVFAAALAYVALADRMAAFTVSKLSPAVMLALAASPCGLRLGVDAWLKRRRDPGAALPRYVAAAGPRFFQILLVVFYAGSAIAKIRGDWLKHPMVLFTHLHDSYQTPLSWAVLSVFPGWTYTLLQAVVLVLEGGAPLLFALRRTRPIALGAAIAMHALIGLMFWPVRWFSLLMISMWCGAFLPREFLERALARLSRYEGPSSTARVSKRA